MTAVALNTFPNVLLIFNICQCLLIIFLIFGKVALYLTKNGRMFFHAALILSLLIVYFFELVSNIVSFVPLSHKLFNQVLLVIFVFILMLLFLMLHCKEYSLLVKEDMQVLHENRFGGQLVFYEVLFAMVFIN